MRRRLTELRSVVRCVVAFVMILATTAPARGQVGSSSIAGYVYDQGALVLPGATITLTDESTAATRETISDDRGYFRFSALNSGAYTLRVALAGFRAYVGTGLRLQVAQDLTTDVTLQVGALEEEVTVTAEAPLLDTSSAVVGQVISSEEIVALPLNGRNFLQLVALSAGALPGFGGFAANQANRPNANVFISGNRDASTSYLLDGVEMRNDRLGILTIRPTVDVLEEFKVQRSFFQAEHGFHPAIVNVITKSGGNQFHGAGWEFFRDDSMDARNFFASGKDPFRQNQFGATLSGPLARNNAFFMVNYEGLRQRLGLTRDGVFPTQRQFSGDLSEPFNRVIYDPATLDPITGAKQPFPGNVIPRDRLNPVALRAVDILFPKLTAPPTGVNLTTHPLQTQTDDQFLTRVDFPNLSILDRATQLVVRYSHSNSDQYLEGLAPLQGLSRPINARNVLGQVTTIVSRSTVNEFRVGFHRNYSPFLYDGAGERNTPTEIGLTGTSLDKALWLAPPFNLAGFSGTGGAFNNETLQNRYTIADTVTMPKGAHTIKAGFEMRRNRTFINTGTFASGSVAFSGRFTSQTQRQPDGTVVIVPNTGSPIADMLLGFPASGNAALGSNRSHFRYIQFGFFVQDDWKPTRDLTLQLGLRYEPSTYPASEEGNVYIFDPTTGTLKFPVLGEVPPGLLTNPHREFGPRLGVAWSPAFDRRATWRAGYGIYFDMSQLNELQFHNFGAPFFTIQSFNQGQAITSAFVLGQNVFPSVEPSAPQPGFVPPPGSNQFTMGTDNKTPTVHQWNVNHQREVGSRAVIEVGYFGSRGVNLSKRYDLDTCSSKDDFLCVQSRRPWPQLAAVFVSSTKGWSEYHSVQTRYDQRLWHGLRLLIGYSWQQSMDNDSGGENSSQRSACLECDWGPSNYDIEHRGTISAVYELPFGRDRALAANVPRAVDWIIGGWTVSAIGTLQSGLPFSVGATDLSGDPSVHSFRANCVSTDYYVEGDLHRNGMQWLNRAAFAQPPAGTYGNCERNLLRGPGLDNVDLSLAKRISFAGAMGLELRVEAFNAFNRPQFGNPINNIASPIFGRITSARQARVMQLGLKVDW